VSLFSECLKLILLGNNISRGKYIKKIELTSSKADKGKLSARIGRKVMGPKYL